MAGDTLGILAALGGFAEGLSRGMQIKQENKFKEQELGAKRAEVQRKVEQDAFEKKYKEDKAIRDELHQEDVIQVMGRDRNNAMRAAAGKKEVDYQAQRDETNRANAEREQQNELNAHNQRMRDLDNQALKVMDDITKTEKSIAGEKPDSEEFISGQKTIQRYQDQLSEIKAQQAKTSSYVDTIHKRRYDPDIKAAETGLVNSEKYTPIEAKSVMTGIIRASSKQDLVDAVKVMQATKDSRTREALKKAIQKKGVELGL